MKNEKEFKEWILDKMEEISEETEQISGESCPFCYQDSYPVNGDLKGYEEIQEAGLEPEEYRIDHYNDCLIVILDKYRIKIEKQGLWSEKMKNCFEMYDNLIIENNKLKDALKNMYFAYVNKDGEFPHQFEEEAIKEYKILIPDEKV